MSSTHIAMLNVVGEAGRLAGVSGKSISPIPGSRRTTTVSAASVTKGTSTMSAAYVAESLIISQGGKLVALIYPDWEQVDKAGIQHSEIEELMQQNIDQLNTEMPAYSKVSCFKLYQEEFEKTPKRSIKRYLYQPAEEN